MSVTICEASVDDLTIVGRYETVRLLGRGGMGEVYLARDPLIDRLVAIKLLAHGLDPAARERFTREARAAGRLQHENIVTIFDVGEHGGRPFIAMEYVEGDTLATLIRQEPPLATAQMLKFVEDACVGLAFAHKAGIIHLDVKPENLIRCNDGRLKVLDFGIARVLEGDATSTMHVIGTLRYMAPEQLTGGPIDRRSDVFALGCVLYEVIARTPAFDGSMTDIVSRINGTRVVPLPQLVPGVHPELVRIARRAMAPDREDRYDDLDVMRRDLAAVRREIAGATDASTLVTVIRDHTPGVRRGLTWTLIAGLVGGLGAGVWVLRHPKDASPPAADTPLVEQPISIAPKEPPSTVADRTEAPLPTPQTTVVQPQPAPRASPPSTATPTPESAAPPAPKNGTAELRSPPPPTNPTPNEFVPPPSIESPRSVPLPTAPPARAPNPEEAVRGALREYEAAYTQRDVGALRKIFPGLSSAQAEAIGRTFAGATSYRVTITVSDVGVTGSTAIATGDVLHEFVPKVGNASKNSMRMRFYLQQTGDAWLIERVEIQKP